MELIIAICIVYGIIMAIVWPQEENPSTQITMNLSTVNEASRILQNCGYKKRESENVIKGILSYSPNIPTEELIKQSVRILNGKS